MDRFTNIKLRLDMLATNLLKEHIKKAEAVYIGAVAFQKEAADILALLKDLTEEKVQEKKA